MQLVGREDVVPVLEVAIAVIAGALVRRRPNRGRGRCRSPSTGRRGRWRPPARSSPSAAGRTIRSSGTPSACQISIASSSGPRPSSSSPSKTVTQIRSGSKPKPSSESSQRERDGVLLEVVAEAEVAEHLEEGQVALRCCRPPRCRGCGSSAARRRDAGAGGFSRAQEVRLERAACRRRSAASRCRRRRDQRGRGQAQVAALLEVGQVSLADLGRGHGRERLVGPLRDGAVADDDVAVAEGRGLTRRRGAGRMIELEAEIGVPSGAGASPSPVVIAHFSGLER